MRFDLSGCGAGLDESAAGLLELGPRAESLGYDGLWINEEHFGQGSRTCLSPIPLATALAMRTHTIRIGFSVLVLPLFEPIRLAEEIATLDVLSEGRVDLGVSRGNTSRYFEAWGLSYEDRSAAFSSCFDKLIRCWTEPKIEVGSRIESIEPKCIQRPHPPIYFATYREEGAAWAAEQGLSLFQGSQQSADSLRRCNRAFRDAGGDAGNVPVGRFVVVGETDQVALQAAWPAAEKLTEGYRRSGEQLRRRISTEEDLETERWLREVAIVGSPETVAARIAALHDDLGFGSLQLVTGFLGHLPQTEVVRTLELFAKEVKPRLQSMLRETEEQSVVTMQRSPEAHQSGRRG
ncbi:LLM class flavin-dependent oxidoreductase [Novosphingobium naphthalenivorans]|uniref:LLM class flavin-dependent oxidoreductase n=1 Tax=Novosphingobium naphthalenivorans TaxID=273168 RepID=UPI0008327BAC|nr:LLM class flavin-dependent oxidoreductase [Novosphingobium naphthalenivorans]